MENSWSHLSFLSRRQQYCGILPRKQSCSTEVFLSVLHTQILSTKNLPEEVGMKWSFLLQALLKDVFHFLPSSPKFLQLHYQLRRLGPLPVNNKRDSQQRQIQEINIVDHFKFVMIDIALDIFCKWCWSWRLFACTFWSLPSRSKE